MSGIVVAPGATFEAWAQFATGATVGVRIRDGAGADFLTRTTSGVVQDIAGSGVFRKSNFTAPTTAGQYQLVWDDGTLYTIESLTVTSSAVATVLSGHDYVTSADLKETLGLTGQTYADADIALAIAAASRDIDEACGRRFWLDTDATSVRYYSPDSARRLMIADLAVLTTLKVDQDGDGTFEETWTAGTDFVLEPLNAAADSWPYESVLRRAVSGYSFPCGYEKSVELTGQFGWPSVPDTIRAATGILAGRLFKRSREAPFGIVTVGADVGAAMRLSRTDPDVASLIGGFTRRTPFL